MLFFNKYNEYKPEKLPENRREQFFDIVKHNFPLLALIGFILLASFLPMLISLFIRDYYFSVAANEYECGNITGEQLSRYTNSLLHTMNIVISFCFCFTALGFSCALKIIRRLVWGEPIFLFNDLVSGIKENFLKYFIFCLVISLSIYGLFSLKMLSIDYWLLKYLPFAIFACIEITSFMHFIVQTNIYNQKLKSLVKNSFTIYFRMPFYTLLFVFVVFGSIYLVSLINIILIKLLVFCAIIIFLFPIILLMWFLITIRFLDEKVNKQIFPDFYNKGLHEVENEKN